jgi:hypothetical protein
VIATPADAVVVVLIAALVIWRVGRFMWLRWGRPCPRCGHRVRAGQMECVYCEYDFYEVGEDR